MVLNVIYNSAGQVIGEETLPDNTGPRAWDAYDFKLRFTPAEHMAILTAAKSQVSVEYFLDLLNTAAATGTLLHSDDAVLLAGVQAMEDAGLIGEGRAAQIVAG